METRSLGNFIRDMFETSAGYSMPGISLLEIKYLLETVAMLLKNAKAIFPIQDFIPGFP